MPSLSMLFLLSMMSMMVCLSVASYYSRKSNKKGCFPIVICSIIGWTLVVIFTVIVMI